MAVLIGVGATISYAQGGWQGLLTFGAGVAGALAAAGVMGAMRTKEQSLEKSTSANKQGSANGVKQPGDELVDDPNVKSAMQKSWAASTDGQSTVQEQGGWIVKDANGNLSVQKFSSAGTSGGISPYPRPSNSVGLFHTHPYSISEGFIHAPSTADISLTRSFGVPSFIIDRISIMRIDPYSQPNFYHDVGTIY